MLLGPGPWGRAWLAGLPSQLRMGMLPAGAWAARLIPPRRSLIAQASVLRIVWSIPHIQITCSATAETHPIAGAARRTAVTARGAL